jgi:hypothetical protein
MLAAIDRSGPRGGLEQDQLEQDQLEQDQAEIGSQSRQGRPGIKQNPYALKTSACAGFVAWNKFSHRARTGDFAPAAR